MNRVIEPITISIHDNIQVENPCIPNMMLFQTSHLSKLDALVTVIDVMHVILLM